jgi:hemoglobin/transferrin/lactoferrin receptor protein
MKIFSLVGLLFGLVLSAGAQTITLTDQQTNAPLEHAVLISQGPKAFAETNARGRADITAFRGSERIEIRLTGYAPAIKSYAELKSLGFSLSLEPSNLNLEEVVVAGTRWRQTSSRVPSKIVSISPREVALQNPQTAADLLSLSGKVYIQKSQQGGGSPMIRGFATNRLLYTVDGVRMNTAIFRGGNIQNVISLDGFAMDNTEVLFGPGSVIYGSDAIGGVMSFNTLIPQLSVLDKPLITGKAVTRYSSANQEKTAHFDVNLGWKKLAFITSFTTSNFDHLRQGTHGPEDYLKDYYVIRQDSMDVVRSQEDRLLQIPSAYSQFNIMQKVHFSPDEHWSFDYGFHYSETSPYGRYDRHNRMRNGTARYAEWNYGPQKWMMHNFSTTHHGNNLVYDDVTLRLAQQSFEESRIDRSLNSDTRTTQIEAVEAFSANLDFTKRISRKHNLFYGVEYVINDVESTGFTTNITTNANTPGPARYPNSVWSSAAVYLNDAYDIANNLTLQGGLRYNQYRLDANFTNNLSYYPFPFSEANINQGSLTGSLGAVYRPGSSWVLSANFGTAFRSPNVDDIGKVFDSEPGAVTIPNPNLKAEYAYNMDLGIAKVFNEVVKLDATAYYTLLQNAMVRRNFQLNGQDSIPYDGQLSQVQAIQNAAFARIYGVQAGIEVKLPAGLSFSSDINYQVGEEELDDGSTSAARHAAPLFGISRLTFKANQLTLQLYSTYQAERKFEDLAVEEQGKDEIYAKDANGNNYAPAWYTLNVKALYALTNTISISAGVENLTDQRYRPYSSGLSAPGRNFVLAFRASF